MRTCPHCGHVGKKRSTPQHRRFFKLIDVAYQNWPEHHDFQPSCAEHLRKFAEMSVGYRTCVASIPIDGLDAERLVDVVRGAVVAAGAFAHVVVHNNYLHVWQARSINYATLPQSEASRLFSDVEDFLASETGIRFEEMMEAA